MTINAAEMLAAILKRDNRSVSAILAAEIAKSAGPQSIPLNGSAVLRAALAGGNGTINGG